MKKNEKKPSKLSRFEKRVEERHKRQEAEYGRDEFLFGAAEDDEEADVEFDDEATSEWDAAEVEADVEDAAASGWNAAEVESAEECTPRVGENTEMIAAEIVEAEMASLAAEMGAEIAGETKVDEAGPHEIGSETMNISAAILAERIAEACLRTVDIRPVLAAFRVVVVHIAVLAALAAFDAAVPGIPDVMQSASPHSASVSP